MCYISLEISFYSTSVCFRCIKINAEIAEKSQVTDRCFYIHWWPRFFNGFFTFSYLILIYLTHKSYKMWVINVKHPSF